MRKAIQITVAVAALLAMSSLPALAHGFHGSVWIGPVWGPGWWGPAYPYPYPYYAAPPVVVQQQPEVYVAPEQAPSYWYFCQNPQGYYPYVKQCPGGWKKVVPSPPAPGTPEDDEEE
jgi:hypothetical protein